jgi:hypothetical protein
VTTPALGIAPEMFERFAELVADRVAGRLHAEPVRRRLVDAAAVADTLGVSRGCVYAHADELGGKHIGNGPRGRLRFDLDKALAVWTSRSESKKSHEQKAPAPGSNSSRRHRPRMGSGAELLPVRGSLTPVDAGRERS